MIKLKVENGMVGHEVGFERIRRITGYLVGTLDRFNNAKRAEVADRVVHETRRPEFLVIAEQANEAKAA